MAWKSWSLFQHLFQNVCVERESCLCKLRSSDELRHRSKNSRVRCHVTSDYVWVNADHECWICPLKFLSFTKSSHLTTMFAFHHRFIHLHPLTRILFAKNAQQVWFQVWFLISESPFTYEAVRKQADSDLARCIQKKISWSIEIQLTDRQSRTKAPIKPNKFVFQATCYRMITSPNHLTLNKVSSNTRINSSYDWLHFMQSRWHNSANVGWKN